MKDDWRPIETAPKGRVLLYYPAKPSNRYGHGGLAAMYVVDFPNARPFRQPTHWMPLEPPDAEP